MHPPARADLYLIPSICAIMFRDEKPLVRVDDSSGEGYVDTQALPVRRAHIVEPTIKPLPPV